MSFTAEVSVANPQHSVVDIRDAEGNFCGALRIQAGSLEQFLSHFVKRPRPLLADTLEGLLREINESGYSPPVRVLVAQVVGAVRTGEWWKL